MKPTQGPFRLRIDVLSYPPQCRLVCPPRAGVRFFMMSSASGKRCDTCSLVNLLRRWCLMRSGAEKKRF